MDGRAPPDAPPEAPPTAPAANAQSEPIDLVYSDDEDVGGEDIGGEKTEKKGEEGGDDEKILPDKIDIRIDTTSTTLIDSGLYKHNQAQIEKLKAKRRSFHIANSIREQLASLQEETKKTMKSLPIQLNSKSTSGLNPFFQKQASHNQERTNAFHKITAAREESSESKKELTELTLVSDEEKWNHLFRHPEWRSSTELVELMKKGIPANMRGKIWKVFLRIETFKSHYPNGYYTSLLALAKLAKSNESDNCGSRSQEIDKDVGRTMPEVSMFKTEEGIEKLKNILYAYALRNPDIVGYCQGMNFIAAGLLTVLEEEDAFWALCVLIEMRLGYYSPTLVSLKVDQSVLNRMVSYKLPDIAYHLEQLGVSVFHFTTQWFLCMYMKSPLCYETAILYWDYLFCYGDEMLFHMALEILRKKRTELLAVREKDEMMTLCLHSMCKRLDKTTFTRIINNIGTLSKQIETLRGYYQKAIIAEIKSNRDDSHTLSARFNLTGPDEAAHLWKIFVGPEPWDVLLTESHSDVSSFAHVFHLACYSNEPDKFCAHGLMSGFMHRLFDILDNNNTQNVTFKSFLQAVYTLRYGSIKVRMKMCFNFFDFDTDGLIGISDLNLGLTIISDMIEGYLPNKFHNRRIKLASDMIRVAKSEEKFINIKFDVGPFGLQLGTEGLYPVVKRILCQQTGDKGVKEGWQLLGINNQSFKGFDDDKIYDAIKSVKFPATLKFRYLVPPDIEEKQLLNQKLDFKGFSKVIRMHMHTDVLFRLHGAVYDWDLGDAAEEEEKRTWWKRGGTKGGGHTRKSSIAAYYTIGGRNQRMSKVDSDGNGFMSAQNMFKF